MTNKLSPQVISSDFSLPIELVERLLAGISKIDLEHELAQIYNLTHPAAIDIKRMNVAGGLRAWGYEVEGGRQGRQSNYKIVGWKETKQLKTVDQWGGLPWEWVQSLPKVTRDDRQWVESQLLSARNRAGTHESSWGYIWSYELSRDIGYKFIDGKSGNSAIIIQKHQNLPRFRIFNFSLTPQEICLYAEELAKTSLQHVRVLFVSDQDLKNLKSLHSEGWKAGRPQAVYSVKRIVENIQELVGSRMMTSFRKCTREIEWGKVQLDSLGKLWDNDKAQMKQVINVWRELNQEKQRQLAVTRDYEYLEIADSQSFCFMGRREHHPCTIHLLDPIIHRPGIAQIVEKSLNYSKYPRTDKPVPGGKYGTADWNVYQTCLYLAENHPEIEFINAGGYTGGGSGLPAHKAIYALSSDDVVSNTYDFNYPFVQREQIAY